MVISEVVETMNSKLWTFGDSFTAGILPDIDHFPPYKAYLKYLGISKKDFPREWGYQLANKLEMDYETHSCGGSSNQEIFFNISKNSNRFKKGDIVIINWTYLNRFMWGLPVDDYDFESLGLPHGKFKRASVASSNDETLLKYASADVYEKLGWNRSLECWIDEIHNFENIIDTLANSVGFKVFYWAAEHHIHTKKLEKLNNKKYICNDIIRSGIDYMKSLDYSVESIPNELFFNSLHAYGCTSIYDETNGEIDDVFHRGIIGNEVQAELFYCWITNTEYPPKKFEYKIST